MSSRRSANQRALEHENVHHVVKLSTRLSRIHVLFLSTDPIRNTSKTSLAMLGDLVELATAVVDPDHTPDINPHIHGAGSSTNMAGSRRRKSQSVASTADANGMPPPASPSLTNPALSRKPRSRSTTSPLGSPKPTGSGLSNSAPVSPQSLSKYVAAVVLSILVEAGLQSLTSAFLGTGELAAVSKRSDSWLEIGGLLAWKIALITFYWFGGFDGTLLNSLTLTSMTDISS